MNPFPYNTPARPATTPVSSSQFNPPQDQVQQEAVPVRPGSTTYPLDQPTRPPPRIRSASTLVPAVRPGPTGWRGFASGAPGPGPSRMSPYNTTNAALAAKQAAKARRAREFDPDYLVLPPSPTKSLPSPTVMPVPAQVPPHVNHHPNGPNNYNPAGSISAAATPTARHQHQPPSQQPAMQNRRPIEPKPITEAEARQAENTAHLKKSLAAIAEIEQRAKSYCDLDPGAGFQFDPSPRH